MGTLFVGVHAQGAGMRWMMLWVGLSGCYTEANWDTHQAGVLCCQAPHQWDHPRATI
jgi:hypothetical protein